MCVSVFSAIHSVPEDHLRDCKLLEDRSRQKDSDSAMSAHAWDPSFYCVASEVNVQEEEVFQHEKTVAFMLLLCMKKNVPEYSEATTSWCDSF